MVDSIVLITYILVVMGFVFIPGPATLLTIARASTSGTKVGIATGAGIAVGDIIHTIMAIVGISAIIAASAILFSVLKYLGAAYLIYLGIKAIIEKDNMDLCSETPSIATKAAFQQAVVAEVLNPKTALFFLAFLPQFVQPENGAVFLQLLILGIIFVLLGLTSTIVFAISAGYLRKFLTQNTIIRRWMSKVVGGIYCSLGIRLALQER